MSRPVGLRGSGFSNIFGQQKLFDQLLSPFRVFYADYANGSDLNSGLNPWDACKTIQEVHDNRMVAGQDDTCIILSDGTTASSQRIIATFTWSKNACHLIGSGASSYNNRARIASLSTVSAFAAFIKVTANGCKFKNFSVFNDYAIAAQITWDELGGRNEYEDVLFGGIGDATSAASTTSRVVRLGGTGASGEHVFRRCTFGIDTMPRTVANSTLEFIGTNASKRNIFENCLFPIYAGATTALTIKSSGSNPLETFQLFKNCIFHNPYPDSSALLQAALATLAANGNGHLIMDNCSRYGVTDWGSNATSLAQIQVFGPAVGATDDVGRGSVAIAS